MFYFKLTSTNLLPLVFVLLLALFLSTGESCLRSSKDHSNRSVVCDSCVSKGKALAGIYCQSCHLFPEPTLLTKKIWQEGVLPNMGPRLGIFSHDFEEYPHSKRDLEVDKNYYPSSPVLSKTEWQHIIDYYIATAPDTIPPPAREPLVDDGGKYFQASGVAPTMSLPITCMVKVDTSSAKHRILASSLATKKIYVYDASLVLTDSIQAPGPITDIAIGKDRWTACNVGVINPNNGRHGTLPQVDLLNHVPKASMKPSIMDSLRRPVQILAADLNQDGRIDYVVCEFGHLAGALSWLENKGNNKFVRHVLREQPGALTIFVNDYNHDGLPDIWALFAQGNEEVVLFTNKGKGDFDQKEVLRFPPQQGSSSFDLVDVNKDGQLDIVYTCGDNADFSKMLKPFHGVYIFLNQGNNSFKQAYFYPINGAFKVCARDFDGDGDIDLAVISFFADYARLPNEGFVYLENQGDFHFSPHCLSQTNVGRWLTMDAGDIDGDGKPDIVLGNFSVAPTFIPSIENWKKGPMIMTLKNITAR